MLELLHDIDGARHQYDVALESYRRVGDRRGEALTLHNLALLHDAQGQFEHALEALRQALAINEAIGERPGAAEDLGAIASIVQALGQHEQARALQEQALAAFEMVGYARGQIWALVDLAILARDEQHFDDAESRLADALQLADRSDDVRERYDVLLNRGDVRLMAGRFTEAASDYAAAMEAAESIRASLILDKEALAYFDAPRLEAASRLVRLYAGPLSDPTVALLWADRAHSRQLVRGLRVNPLLRSRALARQQTNREARLLRQLRRLGRSVEDSTDSGTDPLRAIRQYRATEARLQIVWDELEPFDSQYVGLRRGEPTNWRDLRGCLG